MLDCFQPSAITRSVLGRLCGAHKIKYIHFRAPWDLHSSRKHSWAPHMCSCGPRVIPSTLGQDWSKVAPASFLYFSSCHSEHNVWQKQETRGKFIWAHVYQRVSVLCGAKGKTGNIEFCSYHGRPGTKLGHNLQQSAPKDHTVTDCSPKVTCVHTHTCTHTYTLQPSGRQTFKIFQIQTTTLHREMLQMFSNPITRRNTDALSRKKRHLWLYTHAREGMSVRVKKRHLWLYTRAREGVSVRVKNLGGSRKPFVLILVVRQFVPVKDPRELLELWWVRASHNREVKVMAVG